MRRLIGIAGMLVAISAPLSTANAWERFEELNAPAPRILKGGEQARFEQAMAALIEDNLSTAQRLLKPLADTGVTPAQVALGTILKRYSRSNEQKDALKYFYYAATAGDERAQMEVGQALMDGKWVEQNPVAARRWLKESAKQMDDASQLIRVADSDTLKKAEQAIARKDYQQAQQLLIPLAQEDNARASEMLGKLFARGVLASTTPKQEPADLQTELENAISLMEKGSLSEHEATRVVDVLKRAAAPGKSEAQYRLGMLFLTGQLVEKDEQQGIYWYRLAADQGNTEAQYSLGVRYVLGQGAEQDPYEAHRWFKRAAENGMPKAQHNLALTYLHGIGTDRQIDKAQEWFKKASLSGVQKAKTFVNNPPMQFIATKMEKPDSTAFSESEVITPMPEKKQAPTPQAITAPVKTEKKVTASLDPEPTTTPKLRTMKGWKWFNNLPSTGYTLQMMSGLKPQSVKDFLADYSLDADQTLYYVEKMKKNDWHIVQFGHFETQEQAEAYAKAVSGNYRNFHPIVREVRALKAHIRQKLAQG